jgi:hypothetical protein
MKENTMSRGGYRPGAGRPKGSKTARMPEAGTVAGDAPLSFLLALMNDEAQPAEVRLRAAGLALPYCHAKPAAPTKREEAARRAATAEAGSDWEALLS